MTLCNFFLAGYTENILNDQPHKHTQTYLKHFSDKICFQQKVSVSIAFGYNTCK